MTAKKLQSQRQRRQRSAEVIELEMVLRDTVDSETTFSRADLVFTGIDHSGLSYEVLVYLNNARANANTPRSIDAGYAGRFVIFGHGDCFGTTGHCDVENTTTNAIDSARRHPMTPKGRILTITDALRRVLSTHEGGLESITLVPISKNPKQKDREPTASLLRYEGISLQTYR